MNTISKIIPAGIVLLLAFGAFIFAPRFFAGASTENLLLTDIKVTSGIETTAEDIQETLLVDQQALEVQQPTVLLLEYSDTHSTCSGDASNVTLTFSGLTGDGSVSIAPVGYDSQTIEIDPAVSTYELLFQQKSDGDIWECSDLESLQFNLHIEPQAEKSIAIDTISAHYLHTKREAKLTTSFIYSFGSDFINPTSEDGVIRVERGQELDFAFFIENQGNLQAPPSEYYLNIQESNTCTDELQTDGKTFEREIITQEQLTTNTERCGEDEICSQITENNLNGSHTYIDPESTASLLFEIQTEDITPGTHCAQLVSPQLESSMISVPIDVKDTDIIELVETPASEPDDQEVTLSDEIIVKKHEDVFLLSENPTFEIDVIDRANSTEIAFSQVDERPRFISTSEFSVSAQGYRADGKKLKDPTLSLNPDGTLEVRVPKSYEHKPGRYSIEIEVTDENTNEKLTESIDFTWGVIALNTDYDSYSQNQEMHIMTTVLDDTGKTVCDARVDIDITTPSGSTTNYTTQDGSVLLSDECGPDNFTYKPDFSAKFVETQEAGEYTLSVTAHTPNGVRTYTKTVEVNSKPDYQIHRSTATRIYPVRSYEMEITVEFNRDFNGKITERIPNSFEISSPTGTVVDKGEYKGIEWKTSAKKGQTKVFSYIYDAPDISPELFLAGPLSIGNHTEKRTWEIASDALTSRYAVTCTSANGKTTSLTNAQGAVTLGSTAGYTSFSSANSTVGQPDNRDTVSCSGFSATSLGTFTSANVVFSYAADGVAGGNESTTVAYEVGTGGNNNLVTFTHNTQRSNSTNGGYWSYSAPSITSWTDVGNTTVKFIDTKSGSPDNRDHWIDAVWIEVTYTAASATLSGTCKQHDETTNCANGETIRYAINNTLQPETTTTSSGSWSITMASGPGSGDVITVFKDGVGDSLEAVAVTKYDGTGDVTGVELIEEHLTIGSADNQTLSNADLSTYDNSVSGDEDIFFDVDGSSVLTVDSTSQFTQEELYVLSGNTYEPSASSGLTSNTHDVQVEGTLALQNNTLKVSGSVDVNGTLNGNTSTVVLNASSGTETIDSTGGTASYNNLTFGETSGTATWQLSSGLDVNGDLQVDYGTLDLNGSNTVNLAGDLTLNANGDWTKSTGTLLIDGTGTQVITDSGSTKDDLGDVDVNGTSNTMQLGSSLDLTTLNIASGDSVDLTSNAYTLTILGSGTGGSRPFINSGTLSAGTSSTVLYSSSANTDVEATTYNNLTIENSDNAQSPTFNLGHTTSLTLSAGDLTIGEGTNTVTVDGEIYDPTLDIGGDVLINSNGTLSATSTGAFTVGGSWNNQGIFTANSGRVIFDATTSGHTLSGTMTAASSFNKLRFNGTGGAWTTQSSLAATAANATDTFEVLSGDLTLGNGDGDNLTTEGQLTVGSASAASLATFDGLAPDESILIRVNTDSNPSCTNCKIVVGTTTDADPVSTLTLNESTTVKLNSAASVETGIEVNASGRFAPTGDVYQSGTFTSGTNDTTLNDTAKSWTSSQLISNHIRVTSGLADREIYEITANSSTSATITDDFSSTDTSGSYTSSTQTFTTSTSFVSSDDQAVGQYLYNSTQDKYSRIVSTTDSGGADSIIIENTPDVFTYSGGDSVTISTGIKSGDTYEVVQFARVTGSQASLCDGDNTTNYHGYVSVGTDGELDANNTMLCDLGANVATKTGIYGTAIDAGSTNQQFRIQNSYIHSSYIGVDTSAVSFASVSGSKVADLTADGVNFTSGRNNSITDTTVNQTGGYAFDIDSSPATDSSTSAFYDTTLQAIRVNSSNNTVHDTIETFGGVTESVLVTGSTGTYIYGSSIYGSSGSYRGIHLTNSPNTSIVESSSSGTDSGIYIDGSNPTHVIGSEIGLLSENTHDIEMDSADTLQAYLYNTDLLSTSEANGYTATGSYIISQDHDPTAETALSKIWGEYSIPTDIAETVSVDESIEQFNYAISTYADNSTESTYYGTGSEDADIQITMSTDLTENDVFIAEVTTANGATPTFTVNRLSVTAAPATYTLPSTYTETNDGVQFTIQDGATDFAVGDRFIFTAWTDPGDSNTQKDIEVQSNSSITVDSADTLELKGSGGNLTTVTKSSASSGYSFDVDGTVDFQYYSLSGMDGTGLNFQANVSVTSLDFGIFDDTAGTGGADTYITVDASILGGGKQTFASITFDDGTADSAVEYNVTLSGTPSSPCSKTWDFQDALGNIGDETGDNDNGDGGCNGGNGYILFTTGSNLPPNTPTSLEQKRTDDSLIVTAGWTSETSIKFTVSGTDQDASDSIAVCIELDQIGTSFSGTEDSCGTSVSYLGTAVTLEHTLTGLTNGQTYHWQARIIDSNSQYSSWVAYGGNLESEIDFQVDTTGPSSGTVYDGAIYHTDSEQNLSSLTDLDASWDGFSDAQSGISKWEYSIGLTSGATDLVGWTEKVATGGLFNDDFESGDLTNWDSTATDSGDLSVNSTNTFVGNYSMEANIDDTNSIYASDLTGAQTTHYARIHLDPQNLTMGSGDEFTVLRLLNSTTTRAEVILGYNGTSYYVRAVDSNGATTTSSINISNTAYSSIELYWDASATYQLSLWVDGVEYQTPSTSDTSSLTITEVRMGAIAGIDAGTSGQLYIDNYESDTSSYIGPFDYVLQTVSVPGHLRTGQAYYFNVRATNNAGLTSTVSSSDGISVLPTISFGLDLSSILFNNLNAANSWNDTKSIVTTTTTNAYNGYTVWARVTDNLRHTGNATETIDHFSATNATPTLWSGTGFGYSTSDSTLSGGIADRFTNGGPKYAGFTSVGSGDIVGDYTGNITGTTGILSSDTHTIELKVTADGGQAAGNYQTDLIFIATPNF